MRAFAVTVYGTIEAGSRQDAQQLAARVLPTTVAGRITLNDAEITDQYCCECWCLVTDDDVRCPECRPAGRAA